MRFVFLSLSFVFFGSSAKIFLVFPKILSYCLSSVKRLSKKTLGVFCMINCVVRYNWVLTRIPTWLWKNVWLFLCVCVIHGYDFFYQTLFTMTTSHIIHENYFNYIIFLHFYQYFFKSCATNACILHTCSLLCNLAVNKVWSWFLYLFYFFYFKNEAQYVYSVTCFSLYAQNNVSSRLLFWHKARIIFLHVMELAIFCFLGWSFAHRRLIQTLL